METKIIEATQGVASGFNWGKFCVARFTSEWNRGSQLSRFSSLLRERGWGPGDIWVMDLETCEAAAFTPGGSARADLNKRRILVCPMFEPFLHWLYTQDLTSLQALPDVIELPDAPAAMAGYRRPGPAGQGGHSPK